jgi:hypothetical protein
MSTTSTATPLTAHTIVVATQGLAAADLGTEAVVLDPTAGRYYGLNEVAARILELVESPQRIESVQEALLAEYDVEPSQLWGDLEHFLRELLSRGLIHIQA